MEIQIFGEKELEKRIENGLHIHSHCISIRNSKSSGVSIEKNFISKKIKDSFIDILELYFHDLEKKENLPEGVKGRLPSYRDIKRVYKFYNKAIKHPHFTGFTVHCWSGISRSSAVALGLAYLMISDEEAAARLIMNIRPEAVPLPRVVSFWDRLLKTNLIGQAHIIREEHLKNMRINIMKAVEIYSEDENLQDLEAID